MVHPSATADDVSLEGQRHTLDAASPRPPQPAAAAAKGTGEVAADHEGSPHRHDDPGAKGAVVSTSLHDVYVQYCSEHGLPPLPQLCSAMAALTANSGVRDLTLCNVTIGPSQASALGASLTSPAGSSSQLASITLSHAYLCDEGALSVLRAIGSWPASARSAVHTLDLTGNGLRDAAAIARTVPLLPRLSTLLLEWNKLGAASLDGLAALLRTLGDSKCVTRVDLRNNLLSWEALPLVSRWLGESRNTCLQVVELSWNSLGGTGSTEDGGDARRPASSMAVAAGVMLLGSSNRAVADFVDAVGRCPSLIALGITGNGFARQVHDVIIEKLATNAHRAADMAKNKEAVGYLEHEVSELRSQLLERHEACQATAIALRHAESDRDRLQGVVDLQKMQIAESDEARRRIAADAQLEATKANERTQALQRSLEATGVECAKQVAAACKSLDDVRKVHADANAQTALHITELTATNRSLERQQIETAAKLEMAETAVVRLQENQRRAMEDVAASKMDVMKLTLELTQSKEERDRLLLERTDITATNLRSDSRIRELESQVATQALRIRAAESAMTDAKEVAARDAALVQDAHRRDKSLLEQDFGHRMTALSDQLKARDGMVDELRREIEQMRSSNAQRVADIDAQARRQVDRITELELDLHRQKAVSADALNDRDRADRNSRAYEDRANVLQQDLLRVSQEYQERLVTLTQDTVKRQDGVEAELRRIPDLLQQLKAAQSRIRELERDGQAQRRAMQAKLLESVQAALHD